MVTHTTSELENNVSCEKENNKSSIGCSSNNTISGFNSRDKLDISKANGTGCTCGIQSCDYCAQGGRSNGRKFNKRQIICLIVLSTANFFVAVTYSLLAPFYPEEAQSKGATATEFGLVFGIFELVAFLTSPVFGIYLHNWGPKLVYDTGLFVTGSSTVLFGFLDAFNDHTLFIVFSFLVRIFAALGDAAFTTASFSIIADEFPGYVATTFASLETFFGLGLIVGPTVGGALYQAGGFKLPFISIGVVVLLLAFFATFLLPKTIDEVEEADSNAPGILAAVKVPAVLLAAFSILNGSLTLGFLSATLEPHISQFDLSPILIGSVFIIHGGIYALTAPLWGWLCDKLIHPKLLSLVAAIGIFLGFLFIGPAPFVPIDTILWLTCVGLAIFGIGLGITMVTSFIMALQEAIKGGFPDNIQTYGVISALWNSFFALGAFIGPSVGGFLLDRVGFRWATLFILACQVVIALWTLVSMGFTLGKCGWKDARNIGEVAGSEREPLLGGQAASRPGPSNVSHMIEVEGRMNRTK